MRRRITVLIAAAAVASTVLAAPAQAGNAKKCETKPGDRKEIRCCVKKADSQQERNKCIKRNLD